MTTLQFQTPLGSFVAELADEAAPRTVSNFLRYVEAGAFDGAAFTRTVTHETSGNDLLPEGEDIDDGALPNGDVTISVVQGESRVDFTDWAPIELERTSVTGLSHVDGALSMGRLGPDTATSEFFICLGDQPQLDFGGARNPDGQGFAAFGRITEGLDVVRAIQAAPANGQTLTPAVTIQSVTITSDSPR